MTYTKRELDILLLLRREQMTREQLQKKFGRSDDYWNITLSRLGDLFNTENAWTDVIKLNDVGETVAQAEFDRRFDMYFTRVLALAALIVSIVSVILNVF